MIEVAIMFHMIGLRVELMAFERQFDRTLRCFSEGKRKRGWWKQ